METEKNNQIHSKNTIWRFVFSEASKHFISIFHVSLHLFFNKVVSNIKRNFLKICLPGSLNLFDKRYIPHMECIFYTKDKQKNM